MKNIITIAKTVYTEIAEFCLGIILLFIIVNLIGFLGLEGRDLLKAYGGELVPNNPWVQRAKVYPDMSSEEVYQLHMETWERQLYEYEPVAQFKEKAFSGKFVNVYEQGFRKGAAAQPWPPAGDNYNIFVFGGSTTFSYGLPDWQTLPTKIQNILNARGVSKASVYNFGRAYFYSTHELLQFQGLMMNGYIPDAAIFIDGLNDFYSYRREDKLLWTDRLRKSLKSKEKNSSEMIGAFVKGLPAYKFGAYLVGYFSRAQPDSKEVLARKSIQNIVEGGKTENVSFVLKRYQENMQLIQTLADHFKVKTAFVWQPSPLYKYDLSNHLFTDRIPDKHFATGNGYTVARQWFDDQRFGPNFIWCADIQEGIAKPLYVDAMHYTSEMASMFAECIVDGTKGLVWNETVSP